MEFKIELNEQTTQPVLAIRKTTSVQNLPQEIGVAYEKIIQYLNSLGEKPVDVPFVAYYNMDMENLQVEMGFPVGKPLDAIDDIVPGEIPAGRQISCMYKGAYSEMGPAYEEMMKWVGENGYTARGVSYEFYYNSPREVAESELLTKIVFPLK